ncbi:MAG: prevent-host-death family protein [Halothiobacillaceae bacterium]|nr:MAG: prevent-host-death family protein [Halothiobacillaceae bacterium]
MKKVGSYEAKTHLPALLKEVAEGKRISITNKGRPVAMLVPIESEKPAVGELIAEIKALRQGITLGDMTLKEMIAKGRR